MSLTEHRPVGAPASHAKVPPRRAACSSNGVGLDLVLSARADAAAETRAELRSLMWRSWAELRELARTALGRAAIALAASSMAVEGAAHDLTCEASCADCNTDGDCSASDDDDVHDGGSFALCGGAA